MNSEYKTPSSRPSDLGQAQHFVVPVLAGSNLFIKIIIKRNRQLKSVLFDLILYVPSTIFQLNRDGSSWVEPVLSFD